MLTDEARQSILESILETIKWISDKEYQKGYGFVEKDQKSMTLMRPVISFATSTQF